MIKFNDKLTALRAGESASFFANIKFHEELSEQALGLIKLPTGKIVANDPLCLYETEPFEKTVTPGDYPVILYLHHIEDDRRVSFAEIRFTENIPTHFELAILSGQDIEGMDEDEFYGYGVDSGTGGFMDKLACDTLEEMVKSIDSGMLPELEKMINESYVDTYSTANYTLPETEVNMAVFSSGFGDGCYPTYWGYDENGILCCLITDFLTIDDDDEEDESTFQPPDKKPSMLDKVASLFKRKG